MILCFFHPHTSCHSLGKPYHRVSRILEQTWCPHLVVLPLAVICILSQVPRLVESPEPVTEMSTVHATNILPTLVPSSSHSATGLDSWKSKLSVFKEDDTISADTTSLYDTYAKELGGGYTKSPLSTLDCQLINFISLFVLSSANSLCLSHWLPWHTTKLSNI